MANRMNTMKFSNNNQAQVQMSAKNQPKKSFTMRDQVLRNNNPSNLSKNVLRAANGLKPGLLGLGRKAPIS